MKWPIVICFLGLLGLASERAVGAERTGTDEDFRPKQAAYDADQDGTLDRAERRAYRLALLQFERERQRCRALNLPYLTPEMKRLVRPQAWTPELKAKYDRNGNGRIEPHESGWERIDAMHAAKAAFRGADRNSDGELSAQELEVAGLSLLPVTPDPEGR
jgi:hypothetical protein